MNKYKVLIVDDEIHIRQTLADLIQYQDYEVVTASDGTEALQILKKWTPNIIVSDIMMPNLDGFGLLEAIRSQSQTSHIPFIFLTAKNSQDDMSQSFIKGVDDFISKPFKINDLVKRIEAKIKRFQEIKKHTTLFDFSFEAYVVNEFNNPLFGILSAIDYLEHFNNTIEKEERLELYHAVKYSAEKLNRTISNIIAFQTGINTHLTKRRSMTVEVANCISETIEKLEIFYPNVRDRLIFNIQKCHLKISRIDLNQIIFELLDNALKFSDENSKINVTGHKNTKHFYKLGISDDGIGFEAVDLKNIGALKQFHRKKIKQEGIGLGLYLTNQMINNYGGSLTLKSVSGKGTQVKFKIPAI